MGTKTVRRRLHIEMNINELDDQGRFDAIASIVQNAPNSQPFADVPAINVAVASLDALGVALKTKNDTVAADKAKLRVDLSQEANARSDVDSALLTLKSLYENNAKTHDDLTAGGFKKRGPRPPMAPLLPPELIDVTFPKRLLGQFTVSAHETGKLNGHYAVQVSTEPTAQGPWIDLKGTGKSRKVTGYKSGTVVWVRFALMRGHAQSGWGAPVAVTVP